MVFNVAQLLKGSTGSSRRYELNEEIDDSDDGLEILAPLTGRVLLTRTIRGVLASGLVSTVVRMVCPRCLEPYSQEVRIELEEEFVSVVDINSGASVPIGEDVDPALIIDEHHLLDLSESVRQYLVIAQSTGGPCRADCAGLCPECGQNLNLGQCGCSNTIIGDPRLAALEELL